MRLRHWGWLAAVLPLIGCQDKKSDAPPPGTSSPSPVVVIPKATGGGASTVPENKDLSAPVAGLIRGKPFTPDKVTLQGQRLTFRVGKDFFADMEITIEIPNEKDAKLDGKEWKLGGKEFGDPPINVAAKDGKDGFQKSDFIRGKDYTMTLKIDKLSGKSVEGTIDLRITNPTNTHLVGKFVGEVKKTGYEPLEKDDVPYVHGKIIMKGEWKETPFAVGFFGKGTDGKQHSNMMGISLVSGGNEKGVCSSFEPQLTAILNSKDGPTFQHTRMPPGEYVVYVRRAGVFAAWKKVSVKAGDEQRVDLTIDVANVGSIVATLPDEEANAESDERLQLIPVGIDIPGTYFFTFDTVEVKKGQKTATVNEVPAGKYKVVRGKSEVEVEVVAGKSTAVTLVRVEPKKK